MLKLTDDGAKITLQESPKTVDNGMFWFGFTLLIGAIAVALAMSLLPERLSIAALALLIIGSFIFNRQRLQRKDAMRGMIHGGILWVRSGELIHEEHGKREQVQLLDGDKITLQDEQLHIIAADNTRKYHISGFDSEQEARAACAILQGQLINKRPVNIKITGD